MYANVFKGNPNHGKDGRFAKGSAQSHAEAFKNGVKAGKKGAFSSDSPYPKADSEHEHFVAGLDEGRSQTSSRRMKKTEGWEGDLGVVSKACAPKKKEPMAKKQEPVKHRDLAKTDGWGGMFGV